MEKYLEMVKEYDSNPDVELVEVLSHKLASTLADSDASSVACSDDSELQTVKTNLLKNKLDVEGQEADDAISYVCEEMKDQNRKNRLVFYYLLIQKLGLKDKYVNS
ncbi:hypothetical protein CSB11_01120 [Candidatus Campbellbacteria bacterium]|nr:MAG: hypothetical protein CSB11_01120 [Candidatus Campbellbacteria bacterium]